MAGTATLTLLINGTTCGMIVNYVQMIKIPPIKVRLLKNSIQNMVANTALKEEELKVDTFRTLTDWSKVTEIIGTEDLINRINNMDSQHKVITEARRSSYGGFNTAEIEQETRFKILRILKSSLWGKFEEGQCGPEVIKLLSEACDVALEETEQPICLWDNIY